MSKIVDEYAQFLEEECRRDPSLSLSHDRLAVVLQIHDPEITKSGALMMVSMFARMHPEIGIAE